MFSTNVKDSYKNNCHFLCDSPVFVTRGTRLRLKWTCDVNDIYFPLSLGDSSFSTKETELSKNCWPCSGLTRPWPGRVEACFLWSYRQSWSFPSETHLHLYNVHSTACWKERELVFSRGNVSLSVRSKACRNVVKQDAVISKERHRKMAVV